MRAAVLGSPIAHSLSPVLHRAGYAAAGLSGWEYDAHEVDAAGPGGVRRGPRAAVARAVADHAAQGGRRRGGEHGLRRGAAGAAAVNTLVRRDDGGWDATNTDVARPGARPVPAPPGTVPSARLVLGAGATARSAVLALAELGVTTLTVRARDTSRAADLLAWALDLGAGIRNGSVAALGPWVTTGDDVVVSTLPGSAGEVGGRHRARRAPGRAARRRVRRVADPARPRRPPPPA